MSVLKLFCLVDGNITSSAFSVKIPSDDTVYDIKKLIKIENAVEFKDVDANDLTLWRVCISDEDNDEIPILLNNISDKDKMKLRATHELFELFTEKPPKETIHIIVQRPQPEAKRDREEDPGPSSTRKRHRPITLEDAVEEAGLTEKVVVDGGYKLSRLDSKERVLLLNYIGRKVREDDIFNTLSPTAQELRRAIIEDKSKLSALPDTNLPVALSTTTQPLQGIKKKDTNTISAPSGTKLPIVGTNDLYVREDYKTLHDTILWTFENKRPCTGDEVPNHDVVAGTSGISESDNNDRTRAGDNRIVVTGTSGIGKSAFLVYFAIRILAESDDDNPPIIIFHTKQTAKCYVFGGRSTVRSGDIEVFEPFLNLRDTWYFVDSSPYPVLDEAKTVISYSPKTLYSEAPEYKDVDKEVSWRYYMAPWSLQELETCRISVGGYNKISSELMDELYSKIGGVPRYVLEKPMKELVRCPEDICGATEVALERLEVALKSIESSVTLLQLFSQGKDPLNFSSRLIHCWPTNNHRTCRMEWASAYVVERIIGLLTRDIWDDVMKKIVLGSDGSAGGILFEAYVLRAFREGGHTFELKDLDTGKSAHLEIPQNPKIEHFNTITQAPPGTLFIPKICNYACVDFLLAPKDLFQITVSKDHPIKGLPLKNLINNLKSASWNSDDLRFIFVVPNHVYADFKKQKYLTSDGRVYAINAIPPELQHVKQYALKIDMESAVAGKSPGLQTY